ncbi:helix-turn-helix domain-containing protein [Nonomuraea sp. NPDC050783]|uniref:helix-turn-helix domain-containing protein n=1 Tax=Nonomuraea sp. NPDC050783 TaxID=3154634 RepID=UPI003465F9EC
MKVPGMVVLAVIDGMPMFELSIVCETFGLERLDLADPWYELRLAASGPVCTRNGFTLRPRYGLEALVEADTVVVPALPGDYVDGDARLEPALLDALKAAHERGARLLSLCTGAFALAAAGLLDGRTATTHWMRTDLMRARHPLVRVDPSVLYVDDGDILTSAGRSAGLDLCLHVIRKDLGFEVANQVARRLVVQTHRPGGQAQYIQAPMPRTDGDGLAPLLEWATERLHRPLTVAALARQAGLSPRTLARRFHDATGTTPLRWLHAQRLSRARQLLESTDLPVDRVGQESGLGSAGNLRHHFIRAVGVTPTEYRRAFHEVRP